MFRNSRSLFWVSALIVLFAIGAYAQGGAGVLTGIVYDQTKAIVPGARVTITNAATGIKRTQQTTPSGVYRFENLPVGTYNLVVENEGFRKYEVRNIGISVGLTSTQDITLEVGAAVETVTVEAAGVELVQTTDTQLSSAVNQLDWQAMPLEFRNQNEFINLLAGVVPDDFAGSTRGAAVAGARGGTGNFLVEGYDNNDQGQGGRGAIVAGAITSISPEAIEEYRVIKTYNAEYGKGGGFVTDTVLKSGSNDVHGSVFWYNRVQKFAANNFFSNAGGLQDDRVRNQAGFSLGGPVIKDKSFLFGSLEIHRFREGSPTTTRGVTQEFIDFVGSGAFAAFHESDPAGVCGLFNVDADMNGVGDPCPGAFSNSASLGSIFQGLQNGSFPMALGDSSRNPSNFSSGLASFFGDIEYPVPMFGDVGAISKTAFNEARFSIKSDNNIGVNDTISGTFLYEDSDTANNVNGGDVTLGPPYAAPGASTLAGITWTHTFSPTVLNQGKISYLRHVRDFPNTAGLEDTPSIISYFDELGTGFGNASALPQFFTDNQFQYQDHLSLVRGNHSIKMGGEYRRTRNGSAFEAESNALFWHNDTENLLTDGVFGDELDTVLFGGPAYGGFTIMEASVDPTNPGFFPQYYRGYRANEFAAYVQDEWRVTPRLYLSFGLRWEYFGVPHNFRKGLDSNYYFGSPLPLDVSIDPGADGVLGTADDILPQQSSWLSCNGTADFDPGPDGVLGTADDVSLDNPFFPCGSATSARVANGEFVQRDSDLWHKDTNNFAPRFGFTYDVFGDKRFAIRGGGGVFYDRLWNNLFENIRFNAPFFCFCGFGTLVNGVPAGNLITPGIYTATFTDPSTFTDPMLVPSQPTPSPRHMDERLKTAYWQQYYLGTQWEFMKDWVWEVDYTSTLGRALHGVVDINTFNGRRQGGNTERVNVNLSGDNFRTNAFKSSYHGLQTTLKKRFSNGLQFQANYTWGHAIDELSDAFNARNGLRPRDNANIAYDRGNADFDLRHRFVTSWYYELPVFKGNKWAGGWGISGILTMQKGTPITVFDSGRDANGDFYNTDSPLFLGSSFGDAVLGSGSPADGYLDPAQFQRLSSNLSAACTTLINQGAIGAIDAGTGAAWCNSPLGRNVFTGPGFVNMDFSIQKKFQVTERVAVEFQANFFNIFNHTNFQPLALSSSSDRNLASGNFGRALDAFDPRITQFAIRVDF